MKAKTKNTKKGKQEESRLSHQESKGSLYQAARLEGKVRNRGIKNIGDQKKKEAQGEH